MKRRNFLIRGTLTSSGVIFINSIPSFAKEILRDSSQPEADALYHLFKDPDIQYRPYVRWWWNGDKIEKAELARELRILKDAGIGGVEINPISFPSRTDDMGIRTVEWLSDEWIEILKFTLDEAKSLGMFCDLLLGTGFPCGGEFLEGDERSQVVVIGVKKLKGPLVTEVSVFDLYKEADPAITNPYSGRTMELLEVKLVPDPMNGIDEITDLSNQIKNGVIKVSIPEGKHAIYGLVKITGFMKVIQGVPGGTGPVLNHYNGDAVKKYMNRITDTIQKKTGPLSPYIRSFFVDSLEIEGANWSADIMSEFKKRRGYDLYPYLPFVLFKIASMGNTYDYSYPVQYSTAFNSMLERMRYDFEFTKDEIFRETFIHNFAEWCTANKIKSRAQAYGRSYFPVEGSFEIDIPECETWLKYGIGKDISEADFTRYPWHLGQGNTMINKIVSSAAHLKDKKLISSEEMTNTDMVFNATFEIFKIAGDQSTISGVTQPVFHGFNYSPKDAAFPGWITYGCYFNEKNNFWPYFKHYTDYRTRLSALLQQAAMFADIALLAPFPDMWSKYGAQNEPFPTVVYPAYQMLIWESIHQNGNACDYVSEDVIQNTEVKSGHMTYGNRKYHTLFLINIESINPATAKKMYDFVFNGGRIFCIETYPEKSSGWNDYIEKDREVEEWVTKMKKIPERFIFLDRPENDFIDWYQSIQLKYNITPYLQIRTPKPFVSQVRYQSKDAEIFMFNNSSDEHHYTLEATFQKQIIHRRQAWLWDAVTGDRFKLKLTGGKLVIDLGPADSKLILFDNQQKGLDWKPKPLAGAENIPIEGTWQVTFNHTNGTSVKEQMDVLLDLKDTIDHVHFSGTIFYKNTFNLTDSKDKKYLNLGKVFGISQVTINGKDAGTQWYGTRVFSLDELLKDGENTIEIKVVTVMGNYMKTLKDNEVAQYWTNEKRKDQPLQSMGLVGPVTIY
ncbi:MAG: glycosyl hydrolase [Ginsengibacter sp.]